MTGDSQQWVTVPEAGRLLNKSERTIHRWVSSGRLPSRKESGRLLVDVSDVLPVTGVSDPSSMAVLRSKVTDLQGQVDILQSEVDNLRDLVDRQDREIEFLRQAHAAALRLQQVAIEQPKRSWWPPWKSPGD